MFNKTQLQTNNTQLVSLIQELQGKAAGGGSVETCTVRFITTDSGLNPEPPYITEVHIVKLIDGAIASVEINPNLADTYLDCDYAITTYTLLGETRKAFTSLTVYNCVAHTPISIFEGNATGIKVYGKDIASSSDPFGSNCHVIRDIVDSTIEINVYA